MWKVGSRTSLSYLSGGELVPTYMHAWKKMSKPINMLDVQLLCQSYVCTIFMCLPRTQLCSN